MNPLLVKSDRSKKQTLDTRAQLHQVVSQQRISDLPTASSSGNSLLPSTAPATILDVVDQDVTRILQQDKKLVDEVCKIIEDGEQLQLENKYFS